MKTALQQLQDFNSVYSQEVLFNERYTPAALLSSFGKLIDITKAAIGEITQKISIDDSKQPAYALGFDNTHLDHNQFKSVFKPLVDEIKELNYTSYSSLKIAKIPSGIEMQYVDLLQKLQDFIYKDSLFWQMDSYKEMLSKLLAQEPSMMKSSIARYSSNMLKSLEPQQHILKQIKDNIKDADKTTVKSSVVVANSAQWQKVFDMAFDLNSGIYGDRFDIQQLNKEIKMIAGLVDGIIEDLNEKTEMKGNGIILSELSNATLALAQAVTLRADGIILCLETLGCIHETMVAISQEQKKK